MGGVTPPRRVKERGHEQPERRSHEDQESHAGAECVLLVITKKKTRKGLTEGERRQAEVDTNKETRGAAGRSPTENKKKLKKLRAARRGPEKKYQDAKRKNYGEKTRGRLLLLLLLLLL